MYSINTLKIDEDRLEISVGYDGILIGKKNLELSFNENKTPTFVESGYPYSDLEFDNFIKSVAKLEQTDVSFSFDDQDRFDGFELISTNKEQKYLVIKTLYERSETSIWILLTKETVEGIVSDLNFLAKQINELIKSQLKFYEYIENPYPESDD
jgi:hypothetical protein